MTALAYLDKRKLVELGNRLQEAEEVTDAVMGCRWQTSKQGSEGGMGWEYVRNVTEIEMVTQESESLEKQPKQRFEESTAVAWNDASPAHASVNAFEANWSVNQTKLQVCQSANEFLCLSANEFLYLSGNEFLSQLLN